MNRTCFSILTDDDRENLSGWMAVGVSFISICSLQVGSTHSVNRTASTTFHCYWGHPNRREETRLGIDSVCYDAAQTVQQQLGSLLGRFPVIRLRRRRRRRWINSVQASFLLLLLLL